MDKLKPCPFCGSDAEYLGTYIDEDGLKMHQVACSNFPACVCECVATGLTKEEAIEVWNTRPNPWHTGVPTENGNYLLRLRYANMKFDAVTFRDGKFISYHNHVYMVEDIIKWQKIEED